MKGMITYVHKDTCIHRLSGVTKLSFFLLWTLTAMLTYDTRVLVVMVLVSVALFRVSRTEWRQVAPVVKAMAVFLTINVLAIFLFSPLEGCFIYGTRTELCTITARYVVTVEQLFYEANIILKYVTIVPAVLLFVTATDPSEFAASLARIGLPYTVGYSVSIALRYIPDVQNDYIKIRNAQAARGIEMSAKAGLFTRLKRMAAVLFPLIFTSMERIDVVSNAMELRGFGKHKTRTWYAGRPLRAADIVSVCATVLFCAATLIITSYDGDRFFNPFAGGIGK